MQFGKSIGIACSTFAVTNIDDLFVLVTFFAESSTNAAMTPLKITLGQYVGFTVIVMLSMIGFGASLVLPPEPIGFLGLLPILLGFWKFLGLFIQKAKEQTNSNFAGVRSVFKVASITCMNGGDNIGVYVPLFSQTKGAEIAVYVVVYYILLGAWCFIAYLIMKQKHVLRVAQKYVENLIPLLYLGLGIYIIVKSSCYPWSIHRIDESFFANPGKLIMGLMTTCLLLTCMGVMSWLKLRKKAAQPAPDTDIALAEDQPPTAAGAVNSSHTPTPEGSINASPVVT